MRTYINITQRIKDLESLIINTQDEAEKEKFTAELNFLSATNIDDFKTGKEEIAQDNNTKYYVQEFVPEGSTDQKPLYTRIFVPGNEFTPPKSIINSDPDNTSVEVINSNTHVRRNIKEEDSSVTVTATNKSIMIEFSQGAKNISEGMCAYKDGKRTDIYGIGYNAQGELQGGINKKAANELLGNRELIIKDKEGNEFKYNKELGCFVDKNNKTLECIKSVDQNNGTELSEEAKKMAREIGGQLFESGVSSVQEDENCQQPPSTYPAAGIGGGRHP